MSSHCLKYNKISSDEWIQFLFLALLKSHVPQFQQLDVSSFLSFTLNQEKIIEILKPSLEINKSVFNLLGNSEIQKNPLNYLMYGDTYSPRIKLQQYLYVSVKKNPGLFLQTSLQVTSFPHLLEDLTISEINSYLTSPNFSKLLDSFSNFICDFLKNKKSL